VKALLQANSQPWFKGTLHIEVINTQEAGVCTTTEAGVLTFNPLNQ
jgi:hypothetical protein